MQNERHGVFETNSSSTHSVSILSDVEFFEPIVVESDILKVEEDEFGWGPETWVSSKKKMSYAYTYLRTLEITLMNIIRSDSEKIDTDFKVESKDAQILRLSKQIATRRNMLDRVIKDYTKCSYIIYDLDHHGYIDHQSAPYEDDWFGNQMMTDDQTLKNFLFNRSWALQIDNDNH